MNFLQMICKTVSIAVPSLIRTSPSALIYTNLEVSNKVWALNPITGAVQSFPNTASG